MGISLQIVISDAIPKEGCSHGSQAIKGREVLCKPFDRLLGVGVIQQRCEKLGYVLRATPMVLQQIDEVVGVLLFSPVAKRSRFQHHEGPGPTNPHRALRHFLPQGASADGHGLPVSGYQLQARHDDGRKV
jgi:hypothetical protein